MSICSKEGWDGFIKYKIVVATGHHDRRHLEHDQFFSGDPLVSQLLGRRGGGCRYHPSGKSASECSVLWITGPQKQETSSVTGGVRMGQACPALSGPNRGGGAPPGGTRPARGDPEPGCPCAKREGERRPGRTAMLGACATLRMRSGSTAGTVRVPRWVGPP
jgi:hypothetical protein